MLNHHAYLIQGNQDMYNLVHESIKRFSGISNFHPDIVLHNFGSEKLKVEDGAIIRNSILKNPVSGDFTYTIIYAHTLTEQAQNSLLKICEEPPRTAKIFLITDSVQALLPTLISRFVYKDTELNAVLVKNNLNTPENMSLLNTINTDKNIYLKTQQDSDLNLEKNSTDTLQEKIEKTKRTSKKNALPSNLLDSNVFFESNLEERLKIVKNIHLALDKEQIRINEVWMFIHALEQCVISSIRFMYNINKISTTNNNACVVHNLNRVRELNEKLCVFNRGSLPSFDRKLSAMSLAQNYSHTPGNSIKMILEYLAIHI